MSLFRRKKSVTVEEKEETQVDELEALHAEADRAEELARAEAAKAQRLRQRQGPHDVTEVDEDGDWLDLGALRLPAITAELGLEVDRETQTVRSVTANLGDSAVTIAVFAAPRTEGIWAGVRDHLAAEITRSGGTADIQDGTFGSEILARIPVRTPDGRTGHQATRFIGIDGPRWFMRAVVNGAAAHDKNRAVDVEDVIKGCVVVRGGEAMAPRDLLPLRLPTQAVRVPDPDEEPGDGPIGAGQAADDLKPFERGPQIAEVR